MNTFSNICAVITTYRPDDEFPVRVKQIFDQVNSIVIIDDGEHYENKIKLKKWFKSITNIIVHHNPENIGIAASLNRGISIAKGLGCKWVLTLDDDSFVKPRMIEKLTNAINTIKLNKPIGIIGMSWKDLDDFAKFEENNFLQQTLFSEKRGVITSGSFFSIDTYDKIGSFREDFFIDSVDYEYCLRARAKGYSIIKLSEVGFKHSLGFRKVFTMLGFDVVVDNHDESRLYYGFRNSTVLALEYFRKDPLYSVAVFVGNTKKILKIFLFEEDKQSKITSIFSGIKDGLKKNLGKRIC